MCRLARWDCLGWIGRERERWWGEKLAHERKEGCKVLDRWRMSFDKWDENNA